MVARGEETGGRLTCRSTRPLASVSAGELDRWAAEHPPRAQERMVTCAMAVRYAGTSRKGTSGLIDGEHTGPHLHACVVPGRACWGAW
jgi:hypothetical protein